MINTIVTKASGQPGKFKTETSMRQKRSALSFLNPFTFVISAATVSGKINLYYFPGKY